MPEVHAKLSASSAARWLHCPKSVVLTEGLPDKVSDFAREGTLAHSIAEQVLTEYKTYGRAVMMYPSVPSSVKKDPLYYDGMVDDVKPYVDYVIDTFEAHGEGAVLEIERRVDFSEWVPHGFGTSDALIISDGTLEVIDLKFGKGVMVDATENPQMMLYALGAYDANTYIYDIEKVRMTIVQPRLDHISTFEMSVDGLLAWANETVKPTAQLAYKGEGFQQAGDWCRWCKLKETCRVRANTMLDMTSLREKASLTDDELDYILSHAKEIQNWLSDVERGALERVAGGKPIKGWKLVEGRSNRKIADEGKLIVAMTQAGWGEDEIFKPKELQTLTNLEKLVGKKRFAEEFGDLVYKPEGKATLVPESDKRPELGTAENEFEFEG